MPGLPGCWQGQSGPRRRQAFQILLCCSWQLVQQLEGTKHAPAQQHALSHACAAYSSLKLKEKGIFYQCRSHDDNSQRRWSQKMVATHISIRTKPCLPSVCSYLLLPTRCIALDALAGDTATSPIPHHPYRHIGFAIILHLHQLHVRRA